MTPGRVVLGPFLLPVAVLVTWCLPLMMLVGILLCEMQIGCTVVTRTVIAWVVLLLLEQVIRMLIRVGRLEVCPRRQAVIGVARTVIWLSLTPLLTTLVRPVTVDLIALFRGNLSVRIVLCLLARVLKVVRMTELVRVRQLLPPVMKLALYSTLIRMPLWETIRLPSVACLVLCPVVPVVFETCSVLIVPLKLLLVLLRVPPYLTTFVFARLWSPPMLVVAMAFTATFLVASGLGLLGRGTRFGGAWASGVRSVVDARCWRLNWSGWFL